MASSKELRAQAAELIRQAEALEQKEKEGAREAILSLMRESGLTPEDILGKSSKGMHIASGNKSTKGTGRSTGPVAAQFRDPASGKTWSGRGRAPDWIAGKDREEYRIKEA
jgi:DNA-binding protein H-NS